jgi:hypothetical protein
MVCRGERSLENPRAPGKARTFSGERSAKVCEAAAALKERALLERALADEARTTNIPRRDQDK